MADTLKSKTSNANISMNTWRNQLEPTFNRSEQQEIHEDAFNFIVETIIGPNIAASKLSFFAFFAFFSIFSQRFGGQ